MIRRVRLASLGAVVVSATAIVAALIPSTAVSISPSLAPALPKLLANTVPSVVNSAVTLGAVAENLPLTVIAPLTLAHQAQLTEYVAGEYSTTSPNYHHFLTPKAFADYFGATAAHVDAVTHTLASLGFAVAPVAVNRLYVKFSGTAGQIEKTFGTVIDRLRLPGSLSTFTANVTDLTLPASLSGLISGLIGLNSLAVPHDSLEYPSAAALARDRASVLTTVPETGLDGGAAPCAGAIAGAGYTAPQLAIAYNFNGLYAQGYLGQGMTASLVEFDDYHDSNVDVVQRCFGDMGTVVNRVLVDGGTGGPPGGGEDEDMLDITTMLEMLPKLAKLDVYVAPNTGTAEVDMYNDFVTNDDSPVLSSSWSGCEELDSQSDAILFNTVAEEAAAQGQQIFGDTQDSGASGCRGYPDPLGEDISVQTESASPYVTAVGGTDLAVSSTINGLNDHAEDTWNSDGAGGGGQSTYWTMPSWQASLPSAVAAPGASGVGCDAPSGMLCREVPDLSADADPDFGMQGDTKLQFTDNVGSPGYSIYCATPNCALLDELGLPIPDTLPTSLGPPQGIGGWEPVGGTSAATPLTASAYLLWDQDAQSEGLSGLGYLNPGLYAVADNPAKYATDFYDVTTDSNDAQYDTSDCPSGCNIHHLYQAGPGYDMASGLGSYNATNLGADLVAQATQLTVTPNVATLYGYTKGLATTTPVVVSSGFNGAPYTVTSNASWLHASGGAIGGNLHWSANPSGLKPGTYAGTITMTGHGSTATLVVTYMVTPPASIAVTPWTLHFSEAAVTTSGDPTTPTCGSTIWEDQFTGLVGGKAPTAEELAPSLQSLKIINDGQPGSMLHWSAYFYSETSSWLGQLVNPPGTKAAQSAAGPVISTIGALVAGSSSSIPLASTANDEAAYMNQGTYHGLVHIYDLADPKTLVTVPAILVLGNGTATPTVDVSPRTLGVTAQTGSMISTSLTLSDGSKTCGYAYSAVTNVPWATVNQADYSGTVGAGGATTAFPITIDASGLAPGTYYGDVKIQSQNAEPDPVTVPLTLTVTS